MKGIYIPYGEGKKIAKWLGLKNDYASKVMRGERILSSRMALKVSKRTGIPVETLINENWKARRKTIHQQWREHERDKESNSQG